MFKKMNLQTRIMSAFIIMGLIVLIVGSVGWSSTSRLNKYIDDLLGNAVPSLIGFWQINQGQTNIQSAERLLFAPNITQEKRQIALAQIAQGWQLINEGTKQYEATPFNDKEEEQQYHKFQQNFDAWKQSHQRFLEIEREFRELGIPNPWERRADLLSRGIKENSPEINAVKTALAFRTKMDVEVATREEPLYKIAKEDAQQLLKGNDDLKEEVHKGAEQEVSRSTFWVILGMTIGPLTAIILGIVLSLAIAKPLDKALQGIINMIVSSSTEIGVTVEQQERIASEQATSVNQTTITMEELRASARQAADQAESATENARQVLNLAEEGATGARQVLNLAESGSTGARQVLNLAEEGTTVVGKTLEGMSELKEKVGAIAQQITRLNDQTAQIGSITSAVTDIANQTNMLALNAAVEAVRAGEHGKGFGVVATEIRRLADQSKKSAEKINAIISEIQNAMNSTVLVTDEGTKTVGEGIKLSNDTAQAFRGVVQAINDVVLKNQQMTLTAINDVVLKNQQMTLTAINDIVVKNQQISFTAKQQAVAVQQVVDAMNTLNVGAQQTATGITQTKEGIQKINDAALNLKALV